MARNRIFLLGVALLLLSPWTWQLPEVVREEKLELDPVWIVSEIELGEINKFRGWHEGKFKQLLGRVAWNRPVAVADKFVKNISILLDPNFYFFGEHPRERGGVVSREKLLMINLPLLLLGLWIGFKKNKYWRWRWLGGYLGLVGILALLGINNNLGAAPLVVMLMWPVVVGIEWLVKKRPVWFGVYSLIGIFEIIYWFTNYA